MPKISIIVPVFNTEKYLNQCLDSLINQTLADIEIICVDDGSTDNSLEILQDYASRDDRIKVYSQKNQGVSVARNFGISKAQGEFLTFLDSDDWLELNACEVLYNNIDKCSTDIVLFNFIKYNGRFSSEIDDRIKQLIYASGTNTMNLENNAYDLFNAPMGVCGKLYKTSLIKNSNIIFPENIQCGEDRVFYVEACINANNIYLLDVPLYTYRLDTSGSLTKSSKNTVSHMYDANMKIKEIIYKSEKITNPDELYKIFIESFAISVIYFWNTIYNIKTKSTNIKYLYLIKQEYYNLYKTSKIHTLGYDRLVYEINRYNNLFFAKLLEPFIEIEKRRLRIVIYLFEHQILNISTKLFDNIVFKLRYIKHLWKLRLVSKFRKIKVAFFVGDVSKWTCQSFYDALKNSKHFEPIIYLACHKKQESEFTPIELLNNNINFFRSKNMKYELLYNIECYYHYPIEKYKTDVIFYQQPWQIYETQDINQASKFALTCYIPYCFYSMNSYFNYLMGFHGKLWKYFVETPMHKKMYKKEYSAKNCIALGSVKLDNYKNLNPDNLDKIWKTKDKKRIIYAPHHSFADGIEHGVATFKQNGKFILELAKKHPETEWIYRPHPVFTDRLLKHKIITPDEIKEYYNEWEQIGSISTSNMNYYELFASSDCLITDCISFLAEYLPSKKPVIHLRTKEQLYPFNELISKIIEGYYQVYDNETLENVFNEIILNNNDYLKEERLKKIKLLEIDENKTAGEKIKEYLEKELWLI